MQVNITIDVNERRLGQYDRLEVTRSKRTVRLTSGGKMQLIADSGEVIEFCPQDIENANDFLQRERGY